MLNDNQDTHPESAHALDPLLKPKSIALLGVSARSNSTGRALYDMMRVDGFNGAVHLVNQKYEEIDGQPYYPSLEALAEKVEHVVIGLGNDHLDTALDSVIRHGAKAGTIFASCQSEGSQEASLATRLKRRTRVGRI